MAVLAKVQGHGDEAVEIYKRALEIFEEVLGPEHPKTLACLENYRSVRLGS